MMTLHNRYNRWAKAGVWPRNFEALAAGSPDSPHLIDPSIVRAHQHAAGGKRGRGSGHRPFPWGIDDQDPRRRRCRGVAGSPAADPRSSLRQDHAAEPDRGLAAGPRGHRRFRPSPPSASPSDIMRPRPSRMRPRPSRASLAAEVPAILPKTEPETSPVPPG